MDVNNKGRKGACWVTVFIGYDKRPWQLLSTSTITVLFTVREVWMMPSPFYLRGEISFFTKEFELVAHAVDPGSFCSCPFLKS